VKMESNHSYLSFKFEENKAGNINNDQQLSPESKQQLSNVELNNNHSTGSQSGTSNISNKIVKRNLTGVKSNALNNKADPNEAQSTDKRNPKINADAEASVHSVTSSSAISTVKDKPVLLSVSTSLEMPYVQSSTGGVMSSNLLRAKFGDDLQPVSGVAMGGIKTSAGLQPIQDCSKSEATRSCKVGQLMFGNFDVNQEDLNRFGVGDFNLFQATSLLAKSWEAWSRRDSKDKEWFKPIADLPCSSSTTQPDSKTHQQ